MLLDEEDIQYVVLCENSKFGIKSNSYFRIRFETSTIIPNFWILTITDFLLKEA